jgi:hypothetical protein
VTALSEQFGTPAGSLRHELDENYFRNWKAWRAVTLALDQMAEMGRTRDACVVLLVHTRLAHTQWMHPCQTHYAHVTAAAQSRGFHVIETWPYHRGHTNLALRMKPWGTLPNAKGHALLTRALSDGLAGLPAACFRRR